MNILQRPCNNFNPDSGEKTAIVIHGTAGGTSAVAIALFFKQTEGGTNPVASHYIIDQDGNIVQCVQEKDGAWANGSPLWNNQGISIEHVKASSDNSDALTTLQEQTSFALIKDIMSRHPRITFEGILPHSAVYNTACPGPYPFDRLKTFLTPVPAPDSHMISAATRAWGSFFACNLTKPIPSFFTGIANWWKNEYYKGVFHGPPITYEYTTNDWQGVAIIAQDFTGGTVTWINGSPTWYPVQ